MMRLTVTTPLALVVSADEVRSIRAEDETGSFGILPRHADFLTAIVPSVLAWTTADGRRAYCAVDHGALIVSGGTHVRVATRQAVPGEDLDTLRDAVLQWLREQSEAERRERVETARLQLMTIRHIMRHLHPDIPIEGSLS